MRLRLEEERGSARVLSALEASRLMAPLLRLRQACCHPQVGSAGIRALEHQKRPMSMEEILGVLVAKARVEAEEAQRVLIFNLNALAAVSLLQRAGGRAQGVHLYRRALRTMDDNDREFKADSLQVYHVLVNLDAALRAPPDQEQANEPIAPTLRDSRLASEAQKIRDDYLAPVKGKMVLVHAEVGQAQAKAQKVLLALAAQAGAPL
eukprot:scaffold292_cov376-Prasinococcus_capsulatus_cf.AAC.2